MTKKFTCSSQAKLADHICQGAVSCRQYPGMLLLHETCILQSKGMHYCRYCQTLSQNQRVPQADFQSELTKALALLGAYSPQNLTKNQPNLKNITWTQVILFHFSVLCVSTLSILCNIKGGPAILLSLIIVVHALGVIRWRTVLRFLITTSHLLIV